VKPYYADSNVTLYHGDCLEVTEWLAADVLITDPPYGMKNISRGTYDSTTGITHKPVGAERIASDHNVECRDKALALWGHRPRVVFGTWRQPRPDPVDHRLIWHKQGQAPGPLSAAFMLQDEEIYVTGRGFVESSPPMRTVITTQERRSGQVAVIGHPTPKPVSLMELLITRCPPGVIADPFAGAGATLLAARNQRRQAIGVELEERYCEIAARRLDQMCLDFGTEVGK
jgi:site-specific DNA-methyltransferase (adenine-specific)